MKMKRGIPGSEEIYHKLGNLRITGPVEEVDAFVEWLNAQNCHVYGYAEIQAISGLRSIDMAIDIYGPGNEKREDETKPLKLFVWHEVLLNYDYGIMFALAHTVEEARNVIGRDRPDWMSVSEIYEKDPEVVTSPKGFTLSGGE